jgi:hypothetical protein
MPYKTLGQQVEALKAQLTPKALEQQTLALLREGPDVGGGVNAFRLVEHLLGRSDLRDAEQVWAYNRLKPTLRALFEQLPALCYVEGD